MFVMKKQQTSTSLLLIIIINLSVMFVVVVLAESDHDHDHPHHHHHHSDHQHGHQLLNKAKKIYNGRRASPEEAKFMAAILKPKGGGLTAHQRLLCSAVIITHDTLLTAGHCFENKSRWDVLRLEVLPGASHIDSGYYNTHKDLIRTIRDFQIHPEYDPVYTIYDLAIIKVGPAPWQLPDDRRRVTVAQMPVRIKSERSPLKAYGYGLEEGRVLSGYLNVIHYTRPYPQSYCELLLGKRFQERNLFFATKERTLRKHSKSAGQDHGDSGGGVFAPGTVERLDRSTSNRWIPVDTEILVGIHSHERTRRKHTQRRQFFFHTNVTTLIPWITRFSDARFETYPFPHSFH